MRIMTKGIWVLAATCCCMLLFTGCKSFREQRDALADNGDRGTIHISADESFKPIIDEHVMVYESQHPKVHILVNYKPEADCLRDLLNDSVRMLIVTRRCSEDEKEAVVDSLKKEPRGMVLAQDAIAVIVNPASPDSLFTMQDIKAILRGNFNKR